MNGFIIRWVFAFLLVVATYNPTEWNYVSWTMDNWRNEMALTVFIGLLLMTGYIVYLRATLNSIGLIGMVLVSALVAALVWVLIDQGLIQLNNTERVNWLSLIGLSFVLGIGMSWSHVRRAIAGQYDVEDGDD